MLNRIKALGMRVKLRCQVMIMSVVFLVVVSLVTWTVISRSQDALIEQEAVKLAEIVADQAEVARRVYNRLAVAKLEEDGTGSSAESDKLEGHIPLPAQFLRAMSEETQSVPDTPFSFKPVSRWNLVEDQGIVDDFQQWAWNELKAQEAMAVNDPSQWQPVWRIEKENGRQSLRYMVADPAVSASCVSCHNAYEARPEIAARRIADGMAPGKQWALGELLGAFDVTVDLDQVIALASTQTQSGLLTMAAVTIICLLGLAMLVYTEFARNREQTSELSYQARHDMLTGLPNRLYLELEAEQIRTRQQPFAIMLLDLDNFKQINDTLGHQAGDAVLKESSVRVRDAVMNEGFVARLGGDEFAVLLPGASRDQAVAVADRIAAAVEPGMQIEGYDVAVGASIGISLSPEHGEAVSELFRCADVAMYLAKSAGLCNTVYDASHDDFHVSKLLLNNELREAVLSGAITASFQPKYCLKTGDMIGVEALARWTNASGESVDPEVFIPMAEKLGLMKALTSQMLDVSLRACRSWQDSGYDLSVSVNLSATCLHETGLVAKVEQGLDAYGLKPHHLVLELTEYALMRDREPELSIKVLEALYELGVLISIDDYGNGHTSLTYLTKVPIGELKLDSSFTMRLKQSRKDALVVEATLALARSLGLRIVAKGVEGPEMLNQLCAIGCDQAQGKFLCRPLSEDELRKRLDYILSFNPVCDSKPGGLEWSDEDNRRVA